MSVSEDRIMKAVSDYWGKANIKGVEITSRFPDFVRGTLYVVSIYDANNVEQTNLVYVAGSKIQRFDNIESLAPAIGRGSMVADGLKNVFTVTGFAGITGLIVTVVISLMVYEGRDVPQLMWTAWTSIIAFYFGAAAAGRQSTGKQEST
jgi:hypothetical protein